MRAVARLNYEIEALERMWPESAEAVEKIEVTMDDVARVMELWTGIPAAKVRETEYSKLAHLEALNSKVSASAGRAPCGLGV